jgi:hypothetical protein
MNNNFITENRGKFEDHYTLGKILDDSTQHSILTIILGGKTKVAVCKHKLTGVERVIKIF